jgi:hypothetical protein
LIIQELFLSSTNKTIEIRKLGGVAGGIKYVCRGVVFKLAKDVNIGKGESSLYALLSPLLTVLCCAVLCSRLPVCSFARSLVR